MKFHLMAIAAALAACAPATDVDHKGSFSHTLDEGAKPWTDKPFLDDPQEFRFAIISDLTGGERPHVYERAVENLNLLRPEFVMSVGDLIQGGGVSREELLKQWKS